MRIIESAGGAWASKWCSWLPVNSDTTDSSGSLVRGGVPNSDDTADWSCLEDRSSRRLKICNSRSPPVPTTKHVTLFNFFILLLGIPVFVVLMIIKKSRKLGRHSFTILHLLHLRVVRWCWGDECSVMFLPRLVLLLPLLFLLLPLTLHFCPLFVFPSLPPPKAQKERVLLR